MCVFCKLMDAKVADYEVYHNVAAMCAAFEAMADTINAIIPAVLVGNLAEAQRVAKENAGPIREMTEHLSAISDFPNPSLVEQFLLEEHRAGAEVTLGRIAAQGRAQPTTKRKAGLH